VKERGRKRPSPHVPDQTLWELLSRIMTDYGGKKKRRKGEGRRRVSLLTHERAVLPRTYNCYFLVMGRRKGKEGEGGGEGEGDHRGVTLPEDLD